MRYQYDLIVIGLGPAGMAAAIMAHKMGLKVCAIEQKNIGGECMNVGCIPSKALLRIAKAKHTIETAELMELVVNIKPTIRKPFTKIKEHLDYIRNKKTANLFEEIEVITHPASFLDSHTIQAGNRQVTARRIFIAVGTKPFIPPIPGIDTVPFLTNETIFSLETVPTSMIILGGGAIGVEMAQAFTRLGTTCHIIHADPHIIPQGDAEAAHLLTTIMQQENVTIHDQQKILSVRYENNKVKMRCATGQEIEAEQLLVAAGRKPNLAALDLTNANIVVDNKGSIQVNSKLQTSCKNIYAVGDCNGYRLFSHAAMHQSMLGLMNTMFISPFKFNFKNHVVPWTVFTDPQFSQVGMTEQELIAKKIKFEIIKVNYHDYGAAIAESVDSGFVKVFTSSCGKIYGAVIIGEGSGEMIQEWAMAIQYNINMKKILLLQHSFPTMSFLNKRIAETWMMKKMNSSLLQKICRFMFRV
jgi:pyruvate/2-oxoglutarate dehydrogenase complex dihydrolipoamide dehydrogenase (E3) component